jgi:hypothetical protein
MDKIKGYVGLCAIIIFDLIILLFLIGLFFKVDTTIVAGVIAFVGAIIGGAITLIGVRQTIEFQIRKDRMEKLPEIILNSWKVYKKMIFIQGLELAINAKPELNDQEAIDDYYKENEEKLSELAAKIHPSVYNIVNSFFTHVSDYDAFKNKGKLKEWFAKANEHSEHVARYIYSFEQEFNSLASK